MKHASRLRALERVMSVVCSSCGGVYARVQWKLRGMPHPPPLPPRPACPGCGRKSVDVQFNLESIPLWTWIEHPEMRRGAIEQTGIDPLINLGQGYDPIGRTR